MNDIDLGMEAARLGAVVLLKHWEQLGKDDADLKSRNDWVSRADRESEAAIIAIIREHCPHDAILGEEGGISAEGTSGRTWIIDPLDGTSNYLQHFPVWSISIGVKTASEITAGIVYEPLRDLFFTAERGAGAFRNGKRMHVSNQETLESSFLATGFPFRAQEFVAVYCAIFQEVISVAKGVRRAGSAALDLAYTAAGIFDGFFELHLSPWDIAAGSLLVTEAGGVFTDFSGGERWLERGNIVGATPGVHGDLMRLLSRHVREDQLDRRAIGRAFPSQ
ncbi:MAG TPA: inositol monophosphatase family protein [Thermoanaerobaculia bacterium]|nr:inositol monophosphatase family protein [Thermoanaerobaculia bacterium]